MPTVVTLNRPDVVALIQTAADTLTAGNKTEVIAMGMRALLEQNARGGSLFGRHRGTLWVREDVDLITAGLDEPSEAETGDAIDR